MENILSTTNYAKFGIVETNRPVDKNHVKKLKEVIKKRNLLSLNPILVNDKYEVIDGQHRLQAACELKLPIFYVVSKSITQDDIATLNTNKKNWGLLDYINYHSKNSKNAYKALQLFMRNNHFLPPSVAVKIACGAISSKDVHEGKLASLDLDEAEAFMARLSDMRNHFSEVYTSKFVGAVRQIEKIEGYEHARMVEKIAYNPRAMKPCTTTKEYIKMLEEIYNYKLKDRVRFW
jgi:hypothetical protein